MIPLQLTVICLAFSHGVPLGCSPDRVFPKDLSSLESQDSQSSPSPETPSPPDSRALARRGPEVSFYPPALIPFRMEYSFLPGPERFLELTSAPEDPALQDRIRKVVAAELSRYPPGTLDSLLDAVLIGGELTVGGLRANGAYVFGTVFLTVDETDFGWATSERVVATLHHEISSILLRAHRAKFDEASFRNALPAKFTYEDDRIGLEDHQPLRAWEFDVSLGYLEVGFLKPWAMRNLEQDFNSYAEELFVRPPRLLRLFAAESLVAKKARIVRDFYCSIDPRFAPIFEGAGSPTLYEQAEEPSNAD